MKKILSGRWLVLVIFMIAHGVNDGFGWILPPLLPSIREYYHLSYTDMGAFLTLYRFFGNVLQAPASYLVYFAPASKILVGGLMWMSLGMFAASFCPTYSSMVWVATISGLGRATYHPLAVSALSRIFGREALGRAVALHLSGSSAGMVITPFLVSLLLYYYTWRVPVQLWSALGILSGLGLFFFLKKQEKNGVDVKKALGWPFISRPLVSYLAAVGIWGIAQSGLMTFLPLFLVDHRGFSAGKAAAVFGVMSLSGLIFRPFFGALMDWMGRRKPVVVGGFFTAGIATLLVTMTDNAVLLYLGIVLLGIFGSGHAGLADTFMIEMIPSHRREETLGFIYTTRMGIASLSPLLVGMAAERFSLYASFICLAFVAALTGVMLMRTEEKPAG